MFCETKEDAAQAIDTLCTWLRARGLTLATEKTTLTHLTTGFDFLGCRLRHYRAPQTSRSGYKLLITPSKAPVQRLRETLCMAWRQPIGANATAVVRRLNPLIRGWANYFRPVVATATFRALDNWMFNRAVQ
jgi:RNA-directed DNA polymerase